MLNIKIKRLYLENFKCHKSLTLDFMGGDASIYGDNATGKTSIYDALTWLLFGKDSQGNGEKNIEIKPLDANGEVRDHLAVTAVEAVLLVNGEEVILRRTYKEVWTTKRGSSETTYDGNTSEYYVDGVPCKKNAFQDRVNELVSEDIFRLLTSASHFASGISWQDRRAVLFQVAGVMDDQQILTTSEAFAPLVEGMGRLSIEDYKKKLLAEKRKFVGAKTEIPARISECQKSIEDTQGLDFVGARAEVEALTAQKENLEAQVLAIEHDSAMDQKRLEIREVQFELSKLESENKAFRLSQGGSIYLVQKLRSNLTNLQMRLSRAKQSITKEQEYIADCEKNIERAREQWISTNGEIFIGGTCVTCGQILPADKLQKAKETFEARKQKRLREIEESANDFKKAYTQAKERFDKMVDEAAQVEAEINDLQVQIGAAEASMVEIQDMEGYAERKAAINARIYALNEELAGMAENTLAAKGVLTKQITVIKLDIAERQRIISKEILLDYSRERIERLREDARNAAERLEAIEKMLYLMDEYSRYKTRFVEDSINGLFRIVRFRLFREQANGGVEDRCDVMYDGVPYISLNNGAKINVGIDIINTLSQAYGINVPLFIDNAESVTKLWDVIGSQMIRLVVSENDKELRVDYEG